MDSKAISLTRFQINQNQSKSINPPGIYSEIFGVNSPLYIDEFRLFTACFNSIPNSILEERIDCRKATNWLLENHTINIKDTHFLIRHLRRSKKTELDDVFFYLYEDLIIYFDINNDTVKFLFRNTPVHQINELVSGIKKFKKRKSPHKPYISLLVNTSSGIDTRSLELVAPKLSIEDNYNDEFMEVHKTILKRLSQKNDKGLVLLHGKPGTGKTSYIRYLATRIRKNIIFLPPNMAMAITNPNLMSVLIDNANSVFVIEDAENIVVDRERNGDSPVSALLNISDGLLSDCLNIQIICSFNTDITKVDSALMRKGRLIAKYEFTELAVPKANALSRKLGFQTTIHSPMTLTAIYNQEEMEFQQKRQVNAIGFRAVHDN